MEWEEGKGFFIIVFDGYGVKESELRI